jgi:type II secretory ATPase GspE/PulE/Tfp pilus assembly ATPase PilB-like protein
VRQDPDVILVGEIRDLETAEAAMHAALTGHLVFSTLHTNNAAATVPRLIDLGVEPAIIAPAINVMMAQRLLRKLCMDCKQEYTFNEEEKARLKKEFDEMPKETPIPPEKEWTLYAASGKECLKCHETGYKGRTGIYEIIQIDPEIERLILKQPSEYDIQNQSRKQGQINMREDGLLKVLSGQTDLTELDRVTNV